MPGTDRSRAKACASSTFAARVLPNVHLTNLQAHWLHDEGEVKSELLAEIARSFGMEVSVACSALVIVGYIVGCVAVALFGLLPRLTVGLSWGVLGVAALLPVLTERGNTHRMNPDRLAAIANWYRWWEKQAD